MSFEALQYIGNGFGALKFFANGSKMEARFACENPPKHIVRIRNTKAILDIALLIYALNITLLTQKES